MVATEIPASAGASVAPNLPDTVLSHAHLGLEPSQTLANGEKQEASLFPSLSCSAWLSLKHPDHTGCETLPPQHSQVLHRLLLEEKKHSSAHLATG